MLDGTWLCPCEGLARGDSGRELGGETECHGVPKVSKVMRSRHSRLRVRDDVDGLPGARQKASDLKGLVLAGLFQTPALQALTRECVRHVVSSPSVGGARDSSKCRRSIAARHMV